MHLAPSSFWGPAVIHRICAHSSTEQPAPAAQKQPESCSSFSTTRFGTEIPGTRASGQCRQVQGLGGVSVIGRSMDPTGQVWRVPWHGAGGWGQDGARMGFSCTPPIRKSREPGSTGTMQQVTANLKTRTRLGDVCISLNLQMNKCEKGFNPPPSLQSAKACDRRPILCWYNAEST